MRYGSGLLARTVSKMSINVPTSTNTASRVMPIHVRYSSGLLGIRCCSHRPACRHGLPLCLAARNFLRCAHQAAGIFAGTFGRTFMFLGP
jgi:hypothetical protein